MIRSIISGFLTATASITLSTMGYLGTESIMLRASATVPDTNAPFGLTWGMPEEQIKPALIKAGATCLPNEVCTINIRGDSFKVTAWGKDGPLDKVHLSMLKDSMCLARDHLVSQLTAKYGQPGRSVFNHEWVFPSTRIKLFAADDAYGNCLTMLDYEQTQNNGL